MKSPFMSKTVWVGILQIAVGVCGLLVPFFQAGDYTAASIVALVSGVLTIVMRFISSEPIGFGQSAG